MTADETVRLDLPGNGRYLGLLGPCIHEMLTVAGGVPDSSELSRRLQLAVHEACANIVDHAYRDGRTGRIRISLTVTTSPRRLIVDLHDTGEAFDPSTVPPPNLEEGQVHGYGLYLIRQVMDEVVYYPERGNNRWHLVKDLESQ